MPLSSAIFKSEHKNPVSQCPPRLDVQSISAVLWSRMPNIFLTVETARVSERHGWVVQCLEPLQMMAVHIPEENRSGPGGAGSGLLFTQMLPCPASAMTGTAPRLT
jgi:ryanodine receptor 3